MAVEFTTAISVNGRTRHLLAHPGQYITPPEPHRTLMRYFFRLGWMRRLPAALAISLLAPGIGGSAAGTATVTLCRPFLRVLAGLTGTITTAESLTPITTTTNHHLLVTA